MQSRTRTDGEDGMKQVRKLCELSLDELLAYMEFTPEEEWDAVITAGIEEMHRYRDQLRRYH